MKRIIKIFTYIIISMAFMQHSYADSNKKIDNAKKLFDNKKQEIINKVESWKMDSDEAKEILTKEREKIISETKESIKQEEEIKKEKKVKTMIEEKLSPKLWVFETQNNKNKELIYTRLIEKLNSKLNEINLNDNQKTIISIMIEVLENKKNNLE